MLFIGLLFESIEVAMYALSAVGLTVSGVYVERIAFGTIGYGNLTVGLWEGFVGLIILAFAFLITADKFGPKMQEWMRDSIDRSN